MVALAFLILTLLPRAAESQSRTPEQSRFSHDGRLDVIVAAKTAVHLGLGVAVPLGTYVRAGVTVAAGVMEGSPSGRIDLSARFLLDPFRESRWGPYGGGGVSARFDDNRDAKAYLLLFLGVEGPASRGLSPAIELGLGGGGRLGVILRRGAAERR